MPLCEVDERMSTGTYIAWLYDPECDDHIIKILDDDGAWSLKPRDGREASEMFSHTFYYDWSLDNINSYNKEA